MLMIKILRDPILHLIVVCSGIIAIHGYAISSIPERETIVVDDEMAERVVSQIQHKLKRPPTKAEWKELLNREIQEEILHRQSLVQNQGYSGLFAKTRDGKKTPVFYTEQTGQALGLEEFHDLKKQYRIEFKINNLDLYQQLEANFPVAFKK
jgi:hypothetical protein